MRLVLSVIVPPGSGRRQPEGGAELQPGLSVQHRGADLHRHQQRAAPRRGPRISGARPDFLPEEQPGPKPDLSGSLGAQFRPTFLPTHPLNNNGENSAIFIEINSF